MEQEATSLAGLHSRELCVEESLLVFFHAFSFSELLKILHPPSFLRQGSPISLAVLIALFGLFVFSLSKVKGCCKHILFTLFMVLKKTSFKQLLQFVNVIEQKNVQTLRWVQQIL